MKQTSAVANPLQVYRGLLGPQGIHCKNVRMQDLVAASDHTLSEHSCKPDGCMPRSLHPANVPRPMILTVVRAHDVVPAYTMSLVCPPFAGGRGGAAVAGVALAPPLGALRPIPLGVYVILDWFFVCMQCTRGAC